MGIGYIPENRKTEGLFLMIPLNTIFHFCLEKFINFIKVNRKREFHVDNYSKFLDIKMVSPNQEVFYLSGGNQQKVLVIKMAGD